MKVNELARTVGVEPHVVRYYTRIGLLKPSRDPANNYKRFGHADAERLRFIRRARRLGLNLHDVEHLLWRTDRCCEGLQQRLIERLDENRRHIAELRAQQRRMEGVLRRWRACDGCPGGCGVTCPHVRAALDAEE